MAINIVNDYFLDILCITESWLSIDQPCCVPANYEILRKDRATHGGGVAILYRSELKMKILSLDFEDWLAPTSVEYLCVQFQTNYLKSFIVCVLYRTDNPANDVGNIESILQELIKLRKPFFLLGDFNFNVLKPDGCTKKLLNSIYYLNLEQIVKEPTREKNLLDLCVTNCADQCSSEVLDLNISDHNFVHIKFKVKKCPKIKKNISFRNFRAINWPNFISQINQIPPISFNDCLGCNFFFEEFSGDILNSFNKYCPIIHKSVTEKKNPFKLSENTRHYINMKNSFYKKWKSTNSISHYNAAKSLGKNIRGLINSDYKIFFSNQISTNGFWNAVANNLKPKKLVSSMINIDPDDINSYFCTAAFQDGDTVVDSIVSSLAEKPDNDSNLFFIKSITPLDLISAWKKMKKKDNPCPDPSGISMKMLELIFNIPHAFECIFKLFQVSFKTGQIPDFLKISRIIPIPKISKPVSANDFRPISISCNFLLLLERVYYSQLSEYIKNKNILSKFQFGFRENCSTEHAAIALVDTIKLKLDQGFTCVLVSIDLRKAFDSVNRELLLVKLKKYGISDFWLRDYLSNRKQFVLVDEKVSSVCQNFRGVPQGSILGPILFSLFINDLPNCIQNGFSELFADDSNFLFWDKAYSFSCFQQSVENDMHRVVNWVKENDLCLNTNKTKVLIFSNSRNVYEIQNFTLTLDNVLLQNVQQFKCLGLIIDNKLNWEAHINNIARLSFLKIRYIFGIRQYLPSNYLILIGQSLVLSIISYMSCIWGTAAKKYL